MIGSLPEDHAVTTHQDLCLFLGGDDTSFTGDLLRLIAKADPGNRAALKAAFPRQHAAWAVWCELASDDNPLTARQLRDAIELAAEAGYV